METFPLRAKPATSSYKPRSVASWRSSPCSGQSTYGSRIADTVRQWICGVREHGWQLVVERDRLSLRCLECNCESSGLDLHTTHVRFTWLSERRKRMQLVGLSKRTR